MARRLDAQLAGQELAADDAQPIGDERNAKMPNAKAADVLDTDRSFLERVESLDETERAGVHLVIGPISLDVVAMLGRRLHEHSVHAWDIELVVDPNAVPVDAANVVIDILGLIVRLAAQPTGVEHDVKVHAIDPTRDFTLTPGADARCRRAVPTRGCCLRPMTSFPTARSRTLSSPAGAFIRLEYGRLDPSHTPAVRGDADLDELRGACSGV